MLIITYANKRVEKYFTDFNKLKQKIPVDWVRTIKNTWIDLRPQSVLAIFLKSDWEDRNR